MALTVRREKFTATAPADVGQSTFGNPYSHVPQCRSVRRIDCPEGVAPCRQVFPTDPAQRTFRSTHLKEHA